MEKAATWKSPKSGLFHYAWKSRKSSGYFTLFPQLRRRLDGQAKQKQKQKQKQK
jgi:hypothetical protein